jgi:transcriptional regulator with XRE-family HTH domain
MQINAAKITELRRKRRWSQDELATAAGLNLRTIQRVENTGSVSLQTLKAIAAAFEADIDDLEVIPEKAMNKFEYKTLVLPMTLGFVKQGLPDVSTALNAEARSGWRLAQIFTPTNASGQSYSVVAVLERTAS